MGQIYITMIFKSPNSILYEKTQNWKNSNQGFPKSLSFFQKFEIQNSTKQDGFMSKLKPQICLESSNLVNPYKNCNFLGLKWKKVIWVKFGSAPGRATRVADPPEVRDDLWRQAPLALQARVMHAPTKRCRFDIATTPVGSTRRDKNFGIFLVIFWD